MTTCFSRFRFVPLSLIAVLSGSAALAQVASDSRPTSRPDTGGLEQAVVAYFKEKAWRMTGESTVQTKNDRGDTGDVQVFSSSAGDMGSFSGFGGPFGGGFTGAFEVTKPVEGELVLYTKLRLPGFEIMKAKGRTVSSRAAEDMPPDPSLLMRELVPLLDQEVLTGAIRAANLPSTAGGGGTTQWRFELPVTLLNGPTSSKAPPRFVSRVMRIEALVVLDRNGDLSGFQFTVVHNNPMAAFRGGRMSLGTGDGSGGTRTIVVGRSLGDDPPPAPDEEPVAAPKEVEGSSDVFTLRTATAAPTRRGQLAIDHLRSLMNGDG